MSNDDSFKNKSLGTKIAIVTIVSLILVGSIGFVVAAFYFGVVGLFNLLGVEYDSLLSLVWFTIFYFLLSVFGDIIIKIFIVLTNNSNKWPDNYKKFSILIYSFFVNWGIVSLLNQLMNSINIYLLTQIIFSLIIAILDLISKNDKKK